MPLHSPDLGSLWRAGSSSFVTFLSDSFVWWSFGHSGLNDAKVDIHTHILPNVDDGARSWEMAIHMCNMAAHDGVAHMVATPQRRMPMTNICMTGLICRVYWRNWPSGLGLSGGSSTRLNGS